jgi:hypothetical protein
MLMAPNQLQLPNDRHEALVCSLCEHVLRDPDGKLRKLHICGCCYECGFDDTCYECCVGIRHAVPNGQYCHIYTCPASLLFAACVDNARSIVFTDWSDKQLAYYASEVEKIVGKGELDKLVRAHRASPDLRGSKQFRKALQGARIQAHPEDPPPLPLRKQTLNAPSCPRFPSELLVFNDRPHADPADTPPECKFQ